MTLLWSLSIRRTVTARTPSAAAVAAAVAAVAAAAAAADATGTPSATQPNNTQPNTTPNQGEDKKPVIEPSPQKNADTLDKGNALSQDGGKRATNRGTAVGSNKGRLPKTGEAPFALNFAGTAAGFLLAAYAVLGRRRKER